ncbi:hypothetical protein [Arsenicicoccus dermatophilus]|uniref:hypothetical protein n=1 Tax=Arsenicicoccus dermatophilus TaxID=1076331 RepID=UPI001F4C8207|nr:hypothetical protein [Arsenicicoccus dermatophilus]MCH8614402.1 hypothetical protein [Arsenicicoccus dermatophilus]
MGPTLDTHTAEQKARELLESRITSVRALVTKRAELDHLRAQVAAAETEDAKAYRAALADGWTPDELRKLGIDEPTKHTRTRRRTHTRKTTTNPETTNAGRPDAPTADTPAPQPQPQPQPLH